MARTNVLVVDDEELWRLNMEEFLEGQNCTVQLAESGEEAIRMVDSSTDLVLTDMRMSGISGLELLASLKKNHPDLPVVLVTAEDDVRSAVEAMKNGALDYVVKDKRWEKLLEEAVEKHLSVQKARSNTSSELAHETGYGDFVGTSPAMREVYKQIELMSPSDASLLITGESGTGKELVARTIHRLSPRRDKAFLALNTAAIPGELLESEIFGHEKGAFTGAVERRHGCFELAHQGTLFLDEIGEMPISLQPKLLRVLEDGRVRRVGGGRDFGVDVRVVAATNQSPHQAIQKGKLRQDLFYRLNVFQIELPALRERSEDIALIAQNFLGQFNKKYGIQAKSIAAKALDRMKIYSWPGNVRELRNAVERAVILSQGEPIREENLPPAVRQLQKPALDDLDFPLGTTIAEAEKVLILKTLEGTGNNRQRASELLGVDVKTVRNKLKTYGMT